MGVRAIFYVAGVEKRANEVGIVRCQAVAKGPYKEWAKFSPSGQLEITSLNPAATDWFLERVGQDVALTISDPTEADLLPAAE